MAMIRCTECGREVSDKATTCPNCGAPVDAETADRAPDQVKFENGHFLATSNQLVDLAKKAIGNLNYRVDSADAQSGTVGFTTGVTMGSWSGVSGTISWQETTPYRYEVSGHGKQNVKGGQVVAMNLFDEANAKARKVIAEMSRLAGGSADAAQPQGSCLALVGLIGGVTILAGELATHLI